MRDTEDGWVGKVINPPRSDLVQFVMMQELWAICDRKSFAAVSPIVGRHCMR